MNYVYECVAMNRKESNAFIVGDIDSNINRINFHNYSPITSRKLLHIQIHANTIKLQQK